MKVARWLILLVACATNAQEGTPSIAEKTAGMERLEGFFDIYWDDETGKLYWEIDKFDAVLCQNSALLKDHGCNSMHRKVLASFYQHFNGGSTHEVCVSSRAARSNNGCLTNSRICTWYVMMDPKITPSGQTIVKPTALGTVAKHRR